VIGIISDHFLDPGFNVGRLQEKISISREHLYRKLMAITGESPSTLIRKLRLKTAAFMLREDKTSITEISLHVGFSNPSHFARSFKQEYGVSPQKYRNNPLIIIRS
jgi:AraC-like DNA-binding protein